MERIAYNIGCNVFPQYRSLHKINHTTRIYSRLMNGLFYPGVSVIPVNLLNRISIKKCAIDQ